MANLRHNAFDFNCQSAQKEIQTYQGVNDLYFAGGWTVGAGLHEECWIQGQAISYQFVTGAPSDHHWYDPSRGPGEYAPGYMRPLLGNRE